MRNKACKAQVLHLRRLSKRCLSQSSHSKDSDLMYLNNKNLWQVVTMIGICKISAILKAFVIWRVVPKAYPTLKKRWQNTSEELLNCLQIKDSVRLGHLHNDAVYGMNVLIEPEKSHAVRHHHVEHQAFKLHWLYSNDCTPIQATYWTRIFNGIRITIDARWTV